MKLTHLPASPDSARAHHGRASGRRFPGTRFLFAALLLGLVVGAGCARRYAVTLSRGTIIMAKGKPRYDKPNNCYTFTDVQGQPQSISAARIREIAPASMSGEGTTAPFRISPSH